MIDIKLVDIRTLEQFEQYEAQAESTDQQAQRKRFEHYIAQQLELVDKK